jgi:hypothetical protein
VACRPLGVWSALSCIDGFQGMSTGHAEARAVGIVATTSCAIHGSPISPFVGYVPAAGIACGPTVHTRPAMARAANTWRITIPLYRRMATYVRPLKVSAASHAKNSRSAMAPCLAACSVGSGAADASGRSLIPGVTRNITVQRRSGQGYAWGAVLTGGMCALLRPLPPAKTATLTAVMSNHPQPRLAALVARVLT